MKKISKIIGLLSAALLLGSFIGCDVDVTLTSPEITVGEPVITDMGVLFPLTLPAGATVDVTRQAEDGEEEYIGSAKLGYKNYVDRVASNNELKAGVKYTYRFYNTDGDVTAARSSVNIEKKYYCVEKEVTFESIAAKGTKLTPYTDDEIVIEALELVDGDGNEYTKYTIKVEDNFANAKIYYKDWSWTTYGSMSFNVGKNDTREITITKEWTDENYYIASEPVVKIFGASYNGAGYDNYGNYYSMFNLGYSSIYYYGDYNNNIGDKLKIDWEGTSASTYALSYRKYDNKGNVTETKDIDAKLITSDANDHFAAVIEQKTLVGVEFKKNTTTGEYNKVSFKEIGIVLSETDKKGVTREYEKKITIGSDLTTYTALWLDVDSNPFAKTITVTVYGNNVPETGVNLYRESAGSIDQIKDFTYNKDTKQYKAELKDVKTGVYTFYANIKDCDNLYYYNDGVWEGSDSVDMNIYELTYNSYQSEYQLTYYTPYSNIKDPYVHYSSNLYDNNGNTINNFSLSSSWGNITISVDSSETAGATKGTTYTGYISVYYYQNDDWDYSWDYVDFTIPVTLTVQ